MFQFLPRRHARQRQYSAQSRFVPDDLNLLASILSQKENTYRNESDRSDKINAAAQSLAATHPEQRPWLDKKKDEWYKEWDNLNQQIPDKGSFAYHRAMNQFYEKVNNDPYRKNVIQTNSAMEELRKASMEMKSKGTPYYQPNIEAVDKEGNPLPYQFSGLEQKADYKKKLLDQANSVKSDKWSDFGAAGLTMPDGTNVWYNKTTTTSTNRHKMGMLYGTLNEQERKAFFDDNPNILKMKGNDARYRGINEAISPIVRHLINSEQEIKMDESSVRNKKEENKLITTSALSPWQVQPEVPTLRNVAMGALNSGGANISDPEAAKRIVASWDGKQWNAVLRDKDSSKAGINIHYSTDPSKQDQNTPGAKEYYARLDELGQQYDKFKSLPKTNPTRKAIEDSKTGSELRKAQWVNGMMHRAYQINVPVPSNKATSDFADLQASLLNGWRQVNPETMHIDNSKRDAIYDTDENGNLSSEPAIKKDQMYMYDMQVLSLPAAYEGDPSKRSNKDNKMAVQVRLTPKKEYAAQLTSDGRNKEGLLTRDVILSVDSDRFKQINGANEQSNRNYSFLSGTIGSDSPYRAADGTTRQKLHIPRLYATDQNMAAFDNLDEAEVGY